jgi:hypothetical protein
MAGASVAAGSAAAGTSVGAAAGGEVGSTGAGAWVGAAVGLAQAANSRLKEITKVIIFVRDFIVQLLYFQYVEIRYVSVHSGLF